MIDHIHLSNGGSENRRIRYRAELVSEISASDDRPRSRFGRNSKSGGYSGEGYPKRGGSTP